MQACAYARGGAKRSGSALSGMWTTLPNRQAGFESRTVRQLAAAGAEAAGADAGAAAGAAETVLPLASRESVR